MLQIQSSYNTSMEGTWARFATIRGLDSCHRRRWTISCHENVTKDGPNHTAPTWQIDTRSKLCSTFAIFPLKLQPTIPKESDTHTQHSQQQTSSGQHPNIPTSVHPILGKVCESPGDCGRCSESGKPKESNLGRGEPSEVPGRVPRGLGRKEASQHHIVSQCIT